MAALDKRKARREERKARRAQAQDFRSVSLSAEDKKTKFSFRDPFKNILFLKGALMSLLGVATYARFNIINRMEVKGMEYLHELPARQVMFVSNHETYFAEGIALYHMFSASKWKLKSMRWPLYLLWPRTRAFYVVAEETVKGNGFFPRLLSYSGAVTIRRSWRHEGKDVARSADFRAPAKIKKALAFGWVITFPQGTTSPDAVVRPGAANLIKTLRPIVVPVNVKGFREAFDKKGIKLRQRGTQLSVTFGQPVLFDDDASKASIHQFLVGHIEGDNRQV